MKLCYYKMPGGVTNFGDALNPWLWEKLIPGILNDDKSIAFVGIGSLINEGLPHRTKYAKQIIIFGTGVGYGKGLPKIDKSYKIYCLRGPLSAQMLRLPERLAITDGAVLIRKVFTPKTDRKLHQFAYMPHYELAGKGWELVCQELGFGYIDPRWSVDRILNCISQTQILLAEAMHGAIIADALRVPWIAVRTHSSILSFKWQDWCSSIGVEYRPIYIKRLQHPRDTLDFLTPLRMLRDWKRQEEAAISLKKAVIDQKPILSRDSCIEMLTNQLDEKLQEFQQDAKSGLFS